MKMIDGLPRRSRLDRNTPIELKIREAMAAVEAGDAHPLMTDAVLLLEQALNKVADYVDLPPREWLGKMADAEDKAGSISVGGLAVDTGMIGSDECQNCGIGTYLPSGRCDHCNLHRTDRVNTRSNG